MKRIIVLGVLLLIVYFTWNYDSSKNELQPIAINKIDVKEKPEISSNLPSIRAKETVNKGQVRMPTSEREDISGKRISLIQSPSVEAQLQNGIANEEESPQPNSLQYIEQNLRNKERINEERVFSQSGRKFRSLPGVWAMPKNEVKAQSEGTFVTNLFSFAIVKDQSNPPGSKNALPVVFDTERGTLGVLTGKFSVKYRDKITSSNTAAQYGIGTVQEFPEIRTVIFQSQSVNFNELISKFESLKQDPEFLRVSLDVSESLNSPH